MTTYASFISTLAGVSVTGVTRSYDHEPIQVETADLPAKYVKLPGGGVNLETATTCVGDGKTRSADVVVALEPIGQSNREPNWESVVAMMDYLETALDTLYTSSLFVYTIASGFVTLGEVSHWAVTATCELTE